MKIYCCKCADKIEARLTSGAEIYPHRSDLHELPFWRCDACGNYVGCHYKTNEPTKPLGNIPYPELRKARQHIHKLIDPVWQNGKMKRKALYKAMSDKLGFGFHTSQLRDIDEARRAWVAAKEIIKSLGGTSCQK